MLLGLGAVIFPEEDLRAFSTSMKALREEHNIPQHVEFKWSMPDGDKNYFRTRNEKSLQDLIRTRSIELAIEHHAVATVVVWDLGRTTLQGERAEARVLRYLYERIISTSASSEHSREHTSASSSSTSPPVTTRTRTPGSARRSI